MALSDKQYQAMTPAQIAKDATDGYAVSAKNVQNGVAPVAAWRNVAKLYAGAQDTPTWQNLKAADVAADAAKGTLAPGELEQLAAVDESVPAPKPGWTGRQKAAVAVVVLAGVGYVVGFTPVGPAIRTGWYAVTGAAGAVWAGASSLFRRKKPA